MLAVVSSAIPLGMLSLAIVLSGQHWTGSFATAGALSGLFGGGNALGLALQGIAIDRFGARRTILVSGLTCAAMLVGLSLGGRLGAPVAFLALTAAASGVSIPAVTAAVRSWLGTALTDPGLQGAAYAMLAALFQAGVTVGPAAVSVSLLLGEPSLAIGGAGVLVLFATILLASAGGGGEREQREPSASSFVRGPSIRPGLVTLGGVAFLHGAALGVTAVAISALTTEISRPALAGIALTGRALGEVSGALVYGAFAWPGSRPSRLPAVQSLSVVAALGVFLSTGHSALLLVAVFIAGVLAAPVAVLTSALLDEVVPGDAVGRAYSLIVASGLVATALGNAVAGQLVDVISSRNLLLLPAMAIGAATAWSLARRSTLRR
jgi:MFS family permease